MTKKIKNDSVELLAPAGNPACLAAALQHGADAVYFGIQGAFNMRAGAANFTIEDIPDVAERCAKAGAKAYLTLNTIVFEAERIQAGQLLDRIGHDVDAVIAWDPAVIQLCLDRDVPVHLSTQASVANVEAARFYKNLGVERIVPARECTLEDLEWIRSQVDVQLEVFVHGAMCVSVSGRCFLSQFTTGKSGNRGECVQNCRRAYRIVDEDDETDVEVHSDHLLSAKDLCALPFLDRIVACGIDAVKIEGRNKAPDYVATTVACYRRALDAIAQGTFEPRLVEDLTKELGTVFHRGFSNGFYLGRPIDEFSTSSGNQSRFRKAYVGPVVNHYANVDVAEIEVRDTPVAVGDQIRIQGPTTGDVQMHLHELRVDEVPVARVERGASAVTFPCPRKVRRNDRVFVLTPR